MTSPAAHRRKTQPSPVSILSGEEKGPKRQAVCLNAGAAFYIDRQDRDHPADGDASRRERSSMSGAAMKKLEELCKGEQPMNDPGGDLAAKTTERIRKEKESDSSFHPPLRCGEEARAESPENFSLRRL